MSEWYRLTIFAFIFKYFVGRSQTSNIFKSIPIYRSAIEIVGEVIVGGVSYSYDANGAG